MAARRTALNEVSSWEREEKAHQQRDYAAQLQEQILQKQVKLEQEKARRRQEQREELEIFDRERAAVIQQRQSHQETKSIVQAPSPKRTNLNNHPLDENLQQRGTTLTSPLLASRSSSGLSVDSISGGVTNETLQPNIATIPRSSSEIVTYVPEFSSAPSVFESFLRESGIGARSIAFYEELKTLQNLSTELEAATSQRRTEAQKCYVKPSFFCLEDISTVSPNVLQPSIRTHNDEFSRKEDAKERNSYLGGAPRSSHEALNGESVLLRLTTKKSSRLDEEKGYSEPQFRRLVTEMDIDDSKVTSTDCLDSRSEMLQFSS